MSDPVAVPGIEEICRKVLTQTLRLRRGENLIVESWTHMLPWANTFVLEARKLGIRTTMFYEDEATYWRSVEEAKAVDVGRMPDPELGAIAKADGYVYLWGPEDRARLRALPKEQFAALNAFNGRWYEAAEKSHLRGCRLEFGQATATAARHYGVSLSAWQDGLLDASQVDMSSLARDAARLSERLRKGKSLTLTHANGTRLELQLAGRKPVVDDGIVDAADVRSGNNMTTFPGGAVYVALEEKNATGTLIANRTSNPTKGPMSGGRWTFAENRLSEYTYESGGERFTEAFDAAGPGKDRPGFLSVGLNPRIRGAPGIEDFERGAILVGVGANTAFGGKNKLGFQSWLAIAGAHLEVDGKTVVADGEIL
ncbi:MAG: aminopeptidase [Thermoplasmata archaeon]|nr:aminopeptidase [Thermoplasmata archaeon]